MFKTFPEFSKLTLDDKEEYERYIKGFPPIADISFQNAMTWWNTMDSMSVSVLNNNLVIPVWIPGYEHKSGFSLVGVNESICAIFDYQRETSRGLRLVNVPDLTVSRVKFSSLFSIHDQRMDYEYIMEVSRFYPIENAPLFRKRRVERTLEHLGLSVESRTLDLGLSANRKLLLQEAEKWRHKNLNDLGKLEIEIMEYNLTHAASLEVQNVCLFIGDKMLGFCLYQLRHNKDMAILLHIKATSNRMLRFDLMSYLLGEWFTRLQIKYFNINSDMGILPLRMFMLTLGPVNFCRKYIIEPAQ